MAASPRYKVYSPSGEYVASCKYAEHAAALLALEGDDATVRLNHRRVLYKQGVDGDAGESYDAATIVIHHREEGDR